jgi:hypothetical protein
LWDQGKFVVWLIYFLLWLFAFLSLFSIKNAKHNHLKLKQVNPLFSVHDPYSCANSKRQMISGDDNQR